MGLFGPLKDDVWIQLSDEINGKWEGCTFLKSSRVTVLYRNWTITLKSRNNKPGSSYTTILEVPFVSPSRFQFHMYPQSGLSEILISLGMKDIQVGITEFDKAYVLKGSNEEQVRQLFMNCKIQSLISKMPDLSIGAYSTCDFESMEAYNTCMLSVHRNGLVKDIEFLKLLFELFKEILDMMSLNGLASDEAPKHGL